MTQIDFYTHAEDKLQTACTLAGKAMAIDLRVLMLTADTAMAARIDQLLWNYPATAFIPHCRFGDPLADVTPVIIDHRADQMMANGPHDDLLVNLCSDCPPIFSRFQRVIEIVGMDDDDRQLARERFRFYRDRGYEIRTHDIGKMSGKGSGGDGGNGAVRHEE
ncbi:MAG: DNA polymerase III subunit chi [Pseudomonadota bacterium]|nr:DNA polymerase III subunit chi [Burkholderiales bacterium]MDQ3195199.1 DNA polymerase III subunit chi [Pseudomonadota bacterium]